jgi:hypothetical protein
MRDQVSDAYKTKGKITGLYTLINTFFKKTLPPALRLLFIVSNYCCQ